MKWWLFRLIRWEFQYAYERNIKIDKCLTYKASIHEDDIINNWEKWGLRKKLGIEKKLEIEKKITICYMSMEKSKSIFYNFQNLLLV